MSFFAILDSDEENETNNIKVAVPKKEKDTAKTTPAVAKTAAIVKPADKAAGDKKDAIKKDAAPKKTVPGEAKKPATDKPKKWLRPMLLRKPI